MPEQSKKQERERLWERIRAHLRAAMYENDLGLSEAAERLHEDKGALSAYLKGRAPSAYLVYRIQRVFDVTAADLLNKDVEDPRFLRPGPPVLRDRRYAMKSEDRPATPSDASREAPPAPGKRHHS